MNNQELLRELAESYLKSIIAEASGSLSADFDSFAPFGELGIDSFRVLKIIRRLEADFGTLPKSLLFEHFNVNDLAGYLAGKHEGTLTAKFAEQLNDTHSHVNTNGHQTRSPEVHEKTVAGIEADPVSQKPGPIRILEKEAYVHPELKELVQGLFDKYKVEGCVSRGTHKIAPNLFIGSERRGYFNYARSNKIILVYGYTGPRDYLHALLEEVHHYCTVNNFQFNIFTDEEIPSLGGKAFSSTPFGVLQRLLNLKEFTLEGGPMRRLRYQVSKFEKAGACRTQEYRCGSEPEIDSKIAAVIDQWCKTRTVVNPLVHDVKAEILGGTLGSEHRLFLTFMDDVLQNVIMITEMSAEMNGYLMDLEFYPPDMPMGGLEFAVVKIIDALAAEGRDLLSLGGTYGCQFDPCSSADPEIEKVLHDLHEQKIFNDDGNLQFKNKFRPETRTIFLCRPIGSGSADNVIDIIMMIADPDKMQTSEKENHNFGVTRSSSGTLVEERPALEPSAAPVALEGSPRWSILSKFGFNPINIPHEHVDFDLKTDSWAQLQSPSIAAQITHLRAHLQQPASLEDSLRAVFPFAHFVVTGSGQEAEHVFFKAWPKKGIVFQNLLFPSTIFHQIDKGFAARELPHPAVFDFNSHKLCKGDMALEMLQEQIAKDPRAVAMVCIEVSNNASGGCPVSLEHLRRIKASLARYSIPLVIDATRVLENAQFLLENEPECAGKSLWTVVREILTCADAVIGSLTKDFCVNKGGIIATNDTELFRRLEGIANAEGDGIDLIDKRMIALSFRNRKQIEARVLRRMEAVRRMWRTLKEHKVPVLQPVGGHCVLIDVKNIPEFKGFNHPVPSFLAWTFLNTGIRAAAHSVGMQKQTVINDLVRLAVPVGMTLEEIDTILERLLDLFQEKRDIPELTLESSAPQPLGNVHANYKPIRYHNLLSTEAARADSEGVLVAKTNTVTDASLLTPDYASIGGAAVEDVSKEKQSPEKTRKQDRGRTKDIAIIGMAGRYPKAKNLREMWENLMQGRDCIEELPADRSERRRQHGKAETYRGGFIDDIDKFDSLFFNISPREAEMLDPQERLFLEVAWEAIEDAGYYPETLVGPEAQRNIGVFVGAVWAMYQMLGVEEKHAGNEIVPNSFLWSIANRVSYYLNLCGPSLTVDTACSSSLTALHLACEAIHAGECSAAIVGGVNLDLHHAKFDINEAGGALSTDGVCRSFGKGANGYVAGEGVGALLLKPFDQAVHDGDYIYGVIKSSAINHGGRTSGYTVPNPRAQTNLILAALEKANIDARSIGYIEAHGTGTELGDPVEITGLSHAFSSHNVTNQSCAIGSIKSNIGHLEAAAGVVGISKVLLQMRHRRLAPSLHSSELNEFIDFKNSPFYVVQRLEEWLPREVDGKRLPLRAGISSFGAGGSNAHVILESYEPAEHTNGKAPATPQLVFPLAARNEDQLREAAVRLAAFLSEGDTELDDVAFTLQAGRKSFEHRVAVIAGGKDELLEKLAAFIAGKKGEGIVVGHVKSVEAITRLLNRREREEFVRLLSQSKDPNKIAGLWAEGLLADWQGFQWNGVGKRVSLPTYPFADKRHWAHGNSPVRRALHSAPGLHPMVDSNESTFERQLFRKTFHGRDFFIYDHLVANVPTLPGVAYLELARKAGEIAAGRKVRKIKNIVWVSPISIQDGKPKEVFIELKPSQATVRFEVFSLDEKGNKALHSQGTLLYSTSKEEAAEPEYVDPESIRARCSRVTDGKTTYPLFKSFGLNLGPSFQVLKDVYKNEREVLGVLELPEFRHADLQSMVLQPSLVDGSLQAGMGAQLGEKVDEMFVPFSIGEVEILHALEPRCFSYVTEAKDDKKGAKAGSRVLKTDVLILDEKGKVLVKLRESIGVPLREIYTKPEDTDADGFSTLYYSYEWDKATLAVEAGAQPVPESIVLFVADEALRDAYQERLRAAGKKSTDVILVQPGETFRESGNHFFEVNPKSKNDFEQFFDALIKKQYSLENICFAWSVRHGDPNEGNHEKRASESLDEGVYPFLFLCQALIKHKLEPKVRLLYLSSAKPNEIQPYDEAMRGFVNTVRLEHPRLFCKTLEVPQETPNCAEILDAAIAEFLAPRGDESAVRYEREERYIKKLKAFDLQDTPATSPQGVLLKQKGAYLVTGGIGGLGLIFTEFLATEYKARLVLAGRSKLSAENEARLEEFRKAGAEVIYVATDISNYDEVKNLVGQAKSQFGEINGVIHAAGVLRDSLVRNKTAEEMAAVFAPKIHGTLHLDELTKDENLDFFVTFSSLAAVAGNGGQCDYSFANHFMDSVIAHRELLRAKGERAGKSLSVNWSLWKQGGMRVDEQTELYFKKTLGMKPLSSRTGLEVFVKGLASERAQFAILEGVQEKIELAWGLRKKKAPEAPASPLSSGQPADAQGAEEPGGEFLEWIQNELSEMVMAFLKLDPKDMATDKILLDLGFDSVGLTTFANDINDKYQLDITPVLFFDYPSVAEIAKYLSLERANEIRSFYPGSTTAGPTGASAPARDLQTKAIVSELESTVNYVIGKGWSPGQVGVEAVPATSVRGSSSEPDHLMDMPIAIVGISGVMPQSDDVEQFWENLKNSKDMITPIPADRWRWEDYYGNPLKEINKSNSKWGGFMNQVDRFDPAFFGIPQREAQAMDPQQRIFLETVWKAVEDSGQKVSDLSGTKTGLFVGVATHDYTDVINTFQVPLDGYTASGNSHSVLVNRVSFLLNLRGPSAPIDTACSSSLIALNRAVESMRAGNCDMAIVGGVQAILSPAAYISFAMAGMLSNDGKCKTFDKRADGYARGEGCGAIFLKPLRAAEAEGNHIYAVIRGAAENHGGRVISLTAPNASAQSALLIEAYEKAGIDPATVGYIECHGTGTGLGDAIETQALTTAFAELYKRRNKPPAETPHCGLSCVKTNIGHLETAAGMASLLKALLAIKHRQIPASIHFEEINPYIKLNATPFYIVDKLAPWEAPRGEDGTALPRRVGVSGFGFGGANAHIVLEEYVPLEPPYSVPEGEPQLILLSAKNKDRLSAYVQSIHTHLEKTQVELVNLAYTLQVGRDEMPERLAFVASNTEEVKQKFAKFLDGDSHSGDIYQNSVIKSAKSHANGGAADSLVQTLIDQKDLCRLAELWVSGAKIDWRSLYKGRLPRRLAVPAYPFARERYWISDVAGGTEQTRNSQQLRKHSGSQAPIDVRAPEIQSWIHPLLHSNTSTLSQQSYSSTFTGQESFLRWSQPPTNGHKVEHVFPNAAYLEMARAAVEFAAPIPRGSSTIELEDTVWMEAMSAEGSKATIALSANDRGQVHYEIYSGESEGEVIHCQGRISLDVESTFPRLDVSELQAQMGQRLDAESVYAEIAREGVHCGSEYRAIIDLYPGDKELLARLSLSEAARAAMEENNLGQWPLNPILLTGGLQAAIWLLLGSKQSRETSLVPDTLERLRILSPCAEEMLAWVRCSRTALAFSEPMTVDLDLFDPKGNVCVEMRGLTFRQAEETSHPTAQDRWLFATEQPDSSDARGESCVMEAAEKMELFLQQESALLLRKPIETVSVEQNYFELGLSSLGIAHLVQKTSRLLGADLSPSALFEYRDIQSVAAYLALTYRNKVDSLVVVKLKEEPGDSRRGPLLPSAKRVRPIRRNRSLDRLTPLSHANGRAVSGKSKTDTETAVMLEKVLWQEMALDENHEKVTF